MLTPSCEAWRRSVRVRGYQSAINYIAQREDARQRRANFPGRVLYAVLFAALITFLVGLALKSLGWL